jgi:hypothetical protein
MKIQIFKALTQYIQQSTRGEGEGDRPNINILRNNSLNILKTHLGLGLRELSSSALTKRLSVSFSIWELYCTDVIKLYNGEHIHKALSQS